LGPKAITEDEDAEFGAEVHINSDESVAVSGRSDPRKKKKS
jgi:hypothetical protein